MISIQLRNVSLVSVPMLSFVEATVEKDGFMEVLSLAQWLRHLQEDLFLCINLIPCPIRWFPQGQQQIDRKWYHCPRQFDSHFSPLMNDWRHSKWTCNPWNEFLVIRFPPWMLLSMRTTVFWYLRWECKERIPQLFELERDFPSWQAYQNVLLSNQSLIVGSVC